MKTSIKKLTALLAIGLSFYLFALSESAGTAPAPQTSPPLDFDRDIRPIFAARCFGCHGEKKQSGGLRLDVKAPALRGGQSGPAIIAGKSAESLLIKRVTAEHEDERMPPAGPPLTAAQIATLKSWIDGGAVWPENETDRAAARDKRLDHWAWQALKRPGVPAAGNPNLKPRNAIDSFIAAKLGQKGLTMSPEADRRVLIRRLSFDLLGLPTEPARVEQFVNDPDPQAYEKLVDEMLASPRYGERWARHWLDVVHYGDTHGYDKDKPRPNAWPYRDYVIRALNQDKPYARFVEEQLAGDVLYPNERDGVQALGFISAGPWDFIGHAELPETKTDGKIARHLDRDDMAANTIGTFTSVTVHCAQCHNHKFDPITQEDYYSVQAVFSALDRAEKKYFPDSSLTRSYNELEQKKIELTERKRIIERDGAKDAGEPLVKLDGQILDLIKVDPPREEELAALRAKKTRMIDEALKPEARAERAKIESELTPINEKLKGFPTPEVVYAGTVYYGVGDFRGTGPTGGHPRPIYVLARGQVTHPGREVGPGALSMLTFEPARFALSKDASEGERRAALAHWITNPKNPLTWRSIVNRVWQYHFGAGLVTTPNDFGLNGSAPSHPDLLDWLAVEFRDNGGSLKKLHKLIVTSATYRQTSAGNPKAEAIDANNVFLWRQNRRKLEAEAVRDAVLTVSGKLDLTMGGPGWQDFVVEHPEHSPHYEYGLADPEDARTWRRSIYRFIVRSQTQPWMTALDCADPSMRVDKRNESLSPLQALALLNNGFMVTQARHFAERLQKEKADLSEQIELGHRLAFGRAPTDAEREKYITFARNFGLPNLCRVLLNLNEFSFAD